MASSSPSLDPPPAARRYSLPPQRAGASRTQASLARIIGVISTVPPPGLEPPRARGDERGTGVDLRLRLGLPAEIGGGGSAAGPTARGIAGRDRASGEATAAEESISAAESVAGEAPASESECDPSGSGGRSPPKEAPPGHGKECSEITNVRGGEEEEPNKEITGDGGGGAGASNGYLDLLLEAVREVLGGFLEEEHEGAAGAEEEEEEENTEAAGERRRSRRRSCRRRERRKSSSNPSAEEAEEAAAAAAGGGGGGSKRREASWSWGGPLDHVYEETAPVVRSKRGRSQTLPSRYRDSVLEPWTTKPPARRNSPRPRGEALK